MSDAPKPLDEAPAEPQLAFDDSRRLTGANRHFAGPAVTLTPLGPAADDPAAHQRWAAHFTAVARALGWPAAQAHAQVSAGQTLLLAAAPQDGLLTATEVSEWAWERAAAAAGATDYASYDLAQPLGADLAAATAEFARRALAEQQPALTALRAAAAARGLPLLVDDAAISLGAGRGSRTWPLAPASALPRVQDVPWPALHPIPTALVTGSNGKTTTVRLVAAMLREAGFAPGISSTTGIEVDGQTQASGDYAGPAGARAVLRHLGVTAAVLETARGGILRRGLALERADVAVVTNVSEDHFGEYGIESLHDLAVVKLVVAHAVAASPRGTLVLNADDTVLMTAAARLPHAAAATKALFAADHDHPALRAHRGVGGSTCGAVHRGTRAVPGGAALPADAELVLTASAAAGGAEHTLGALTDLPLTLGGTARHNIANLAAAALAALSMGVPIDAIRRSARSFGSHPLDNPGRLERWPWRGATVLLDYAHNPDGLARLLDVARGHRAGPNSRLLLLLGQAGNRGDDAIRDLARTAAGYAPALVMLKDMGAQYLRGRALGEVPALLRVALVGGGVAADRIVERSNEAEAALALLDAALPGDVVVLPVHEDSSRPAIAARLGTSAAVPGSGSSAAR